jgi:ABC-type lipoprotein release transport system permease subunit
MASALWFMVKIDAATFIAFSVVLLSVALLATYIPAGRASKMDPMIALPCEQRPGV